MTAVCTEKVVSKVRLTAVSTLDHKINLNSMIRFLGTQSFYAYMLINHYFLSSSYGFIYRLDDLYRFISIDRCNWRDGVFEY